MDVIEVNNLYKEFYKSRTIRDIANALKVYFLSFADDLFITLPSV